MDTLTELIQYITDNNNLVGEDVDIFRHIYPDEPKDAVVVTPYGGSSTPIFSETSNKNFQIGVRRRTKSEAYSVAMSIYKSLRSKDSPYIHLQTMDCPIMLKDIPFHLKTQQNKYEIYVFNIVITSLN